MKMCHKTSWQGSKLAKKPTQGYFMYYYVTFLQNRFNETIMPVNIATIQHKQKFLLLLCG